MQFKVPQFIDVEDKLFGPLTFKQFAYLVGGAGLIFVIYKFLPIWLAIPIILPVAGLSAALACYRINDQPFIYYLQAFIAYSLKSKLYIWKQRAYKEEVGKEKIEENIQPVSVVPKISSSKLKDLSWSLDVLDKK